MFTLVKEELIIKFLTYYGIDYLYLTADLKAIVVILANIFVLLFWFVVAYILYRVFYKIFG